MTATTTVPSSIACFVIAAAVVVSASHIKELASLTLPAHDVAKVIDDPSHMVKIANDLHHHSDTSGKIQPGDGQSADNRSLRLHDHKKETRGRLANRLRERLALPVFTV